MSAKKNRKAFFFSGASALLLLVFSAMYQHRGISPLEETMPLIILSSLFIATFLPFFLKQFGETWKAEDSFSGFADLVTPHSTSFEFGVPSLLPYRKIQFAPARIAASLAMFLLLLTFAGGSIIANMMASDIPFTVFVLCVAAAVIVCVGLIGLFVVSTMKELKLRRLFHDEVVTGVTGEGFKLVSEFNAEDTTDRRILLGDGRDHYSWWSLTFNEDIALMEWENTRSTGATEGTTEVVQEQ